MWTVETILFEAILHLILRLFFVVFLSQYTAIWHLLLYFTVNFFARLVLLCFLGFCCYPSPILLFLVSRCHFFSVWVNETPPESSCWFIFHSLAKFCDFPCNKKILLQKVSLKVFKRLQKIKKSLRIIPAQIGYFLLYFFIIDNPTYPQTLQAFIGYPYSKWV